MLADIINAVTVWTSGISQTLRLGGAGIFDTAVISGLLAVLLAELVGELLERVARMRGVKAQSRRVHDPREGEDQ